MAQHTSSWNTQRIVTELLHISLVDIDAFSSHEVQASPTAQSPNSNVDRLDTCRHGTLEHHPQS